jgi:hypothetical protein
MTASEFPFDPNGNRARAIPHIAGTVSCRLALVNLEFSLSPMWKFAEFVE